MTSHLNPWISVCGEPSAELTLELEGRVDRHRMAGRFSANDQRYVEKVSLSVTRGSFNTSPERTELLRRLCAIYAVDMKPRDFTSHRPVLGKLIVGAKKLLFQLMRPLIGPALRQQRDFNAAVIYLLTDLCNESVTVRGRSASLPFDDAAT